MATKPVRCGFLFTLKDFSKEYNNQCTNEEDKVDKVTYIDLMADFFTEVMTRVLKERMNFGIPNGMGWVTLTSKKLKVRNAPPNWAKIVQGKTKAKHLNLHSFGRLYSVKWITTNIRNFNNKAWYRFKMANTNRIKDMGLGGKAISDMLKDPNHELIK